MKGVILAAGEGTRLRPLTEETPKPMLPLAGVPLIGYLVELLRLGGVDEIAVNLHHKPETVRGYLGDGSGFGVRITYSHEERLLGSAGALKRLESFLDQPFFVLYGDVLTDLDLRELEAFHTAEGAALTMALSRTREPERCGIVGIDGRGRVRRFQEKPGPGEVFSHLANMGVYAVQQDILRLAPPETFFDCGSHLLPLLLERGEKVCGLVSEAYFLDIGSPERYRQAERDIASGLVRPAVSPRCVVTEVSGR